MPGALSVHQVCKIVDLCLPERTPSPALLENMLSGWMASGEVRFTLTRHSSCLSLQQGAGQPENFSDMSEQSEGTQ